MTRMLPNLPYRTDGGAGERGRIGLIVLATDFTIEQEYRAVLARVPGAALFATRIPMAPDVTPDTLRAMEGGIAPAAALLLPGEDLDVVAYGCSSATALIGEDRVTEIIRAVKPGVHVTSPITAATAALRAFKARRIGVLTPYTADVNAGILDAFRSRGFEVPVLGSFDEPVDSVVAAITEDAIRDGVRRLIESAGVEAVFVSCTNLRVLSFVAAMEEETGLPVTASNHAMIWHGLRLAGIDDRLQGFGRLYGLAL